MLKSKYENKFFLRLITLSLFFLFISHAQKSFAETKNSSPTVCAIGCDYTKIRDAIENSKEHTLITIKEGVYKESRLVISKTIHLYGQGNVIIDAGDGGHIITIFKSNGVSIIGLTLKNTGISYTEELAGIKVVQSKDVLIRSNKFLNTTYGVYLDNSEHCQVANNEFHGEAKDESSGGNGVHAWYGSNHIIEKNKIRGHRDGIYLEFAKGTQARDNDVQFNLRYGLHFMSSSQTEYYRNYFSNNGAGVAVMYSRDIKMYENQFVKNTGPAAYGLLLKEVHNSEISQNYFVKNTVGIFMEGSNRNSFINNNINLNGWALRIMGNCEDNIFQHNNFQLNTFDVTTNTDHNWNQFKDNYWSQYEGYDLNHDGVGDIPYRPVSLSSVLIEMIDSSYILMNSFFFSIMDQVERALPSLVPERLKDESPLMEAVGVKK